MPWVTRGRQKYFYKSKRLPDGRVGKTYYGGGARGEQADREDAAARARCEEDRAEASRNNAALQPLVALAGELDEGVTLLATATLLAGGLHRHKGQWRRRRNGS